MTIQLYEGRLNISVRFYNVVNINVSTTKIGKRTAHRQIIKYYTCNSNMCKSKTEHKCHMIKDYGCHCPNGEYHEILEPRKDVKFYKVFCDMIEQIPYLRWGKYSQFVWDNRENNCDQDTYEILKHIPEFNMKCVTESDNLLEEALSIIEDKKEYHGWQLQRIITPRSRCKLIYSLAEKYGQEVKSYLDLVSMRTFISPAEQARIEFEKNIGNLFHLCGEYVVLEIPYLDNFEKNNVQDIFVYIADKHSVRSWNAVRIKDFTNQKLYDYLINHIPLADNWQTRKYPLYVHVIKKQYPVFLKQLGVVNNEVI